MNHLTLMAPVVLLATPAFAATWTVPGDFATIQKAIDNAIDGDEIVVADGTYTGDGNRDIDFFGKAITLRSEHGPETCIIDVAASPASMHRAFYFDLDETQTTQVIGFTIQNGMMPSGGAVYCADSSPNFQTCIFRQNTARDGGSGAAGGGGAVQFRGQAGAVFEDCQFIDNHVIVDSGWIGGGGAAKTWSAGDQSAAGPYHTHPTLIGCLFRGNTATGAGEAAGGAYLHASFAPPADLIDCTFEGNLAQSGGAVAIGGAATVDGCVFQDNKATTGIGGALLLHGLEEIAQVRDCTFVSNWAAGDGGGAHLGECVLTNVMFLGNHAGAEGGGLVATFSSIDNVTISGNTATSAGGMRGGEVSVDNSIIWGNAAPEVVQGGPLDIKYSNIGGGWPGPGNIDADPLLVAGAPQAGSPCIDQGSNLLVPAGIQVDLDGNPRFVDDPVSRNAVGGSCPNVDMGAIEFQTGKGSPVCCNWDLDGDGAVTTIDFLELLAQWGQPGLADFDGSSAVDTLDLLALLANWGPCA